MTRHWRKKRESDFVKPGFVWTYAHYLTLIFHTLCRGGVLLSGVRTSENQITPGAHLYTPVHHQWTNSVLCVKIKKTQESTPIILKRITEDKENIILLPVVTPLSY